MERSPSIILVDLFTSLFIPEITSLLAFWVDIFIEKY
jgi:antibiotic biosynthesis monooxygenase (ABM) superfamily enzyme